MATSKRTATSAAAEEKAKAAAEAEAKAKAEEKAKAAAEAEAKAKAEEETKAAAEAEAQAKAEEEAKTDKLECEVLEPLLHNGDKYMPGDSIYLTETELAAKQAAGMARFGTPVNEGDDE